MLAWSERRYFKIFSSEIYNADNEIASWTMTALKTFAGLFSRQVFAKITNIEIELGSKINVIDIKQTSGIKKTVQR